ncbi:MAG: U32 family peptidase [Desulfobacterales bacterium]|nr:U32 family peptidase [Desulfobacterales bacterium]
MTALELLAPAKNLEFGKAAINHGADALYIGARKFGARAAAGNPVADIEQLCNHAHKFNARVYVTLNTLLFDNELEPARKLIQRLWNAGADALIIQDMGLLEMDLPPIPLFASTQTDNRTPEKVRFLEESGFQRVILARELSLSQIKKIRAKTNVALEAFVHGALCVCYSGQCYMSAAIGKRSANRGACGQPCRLAWDLVTGTGERLVQNRYLLSLKDMDRSDQLEALAEAGISSFKIEGRLKDIDYVKNITGFYRQRLDSLIEQNSKYTKASSGKTQLGFIPDPAKTFNRGSTPYFLFGRKGPVHSFDTPKSMGEMIGKVTKKTQDHLVLDRPHDLTNGDGICFLDKEGKLTGFYINKVDETGQIFFPGKTNLRKKTIPKGTLIYRNHNNTFSKELAGNTATRKIGLSLEFYETDHGFYLSAKDEDGVRAKVSLNLPKEPAKNPDRAINVIEKQLSKLGNTIFTLEKLEIHSQPYFLAAKTLNQLRRELIETLEEKRIEVYPRIQVKPRPEPVRFYKTRLDFRANVANVLSKQFYEKRGVTSLTPAFEILFPGPGTPVMVTKHCIRYSIGDCPRQKKSSKETDADQFFLERGDTRFQVVFRCRDCEMEIKIPG